MTSLLEVRKLKKYYYEDGNKKIIKALDGLDFSLEAGEVLGVIGESGCGKSTLAKLLIGLEDETEGRINFMDRDLRQWLKRKNRLDFRRQAQMVFQNPYDVFDNRQTIEKILTSTLKIHKIGSSKEDRLRIVKDIMIESGINPPEDFLSRYPHELSGGQLQRISIIRSMLLKPKLVIADEPVSMLDVSIRADVINMLLNIIKKERAGMIFISHDIATTRYVSDRIAVMYLGRIVELGTTEEIISRPIHPYTKALISNCGDIDPSLQSRPIRIDGEPPTPVNTGPACYFYPRCYESLSICKEDYPALVELSPGHFVSCFRYLK